ncbi:hypothetical protein ACCO45_012796 [Purpureocillium lilacinum]|uniref:Uncharacterized protein n=1 Tax=Purpureocillium lilacinum TaxID=33203 RepID=A0ACC4DC40_PURLI
MEDRSGQIVAVNVAFLVLTTLIIGFRIYCRGWIIRSFAGNCYHMDISAFKRRMRVDDARLTVTAMTMSVVNVA